MMTTDNPIQTFTRLGIFLEQFIEPDKSSRLDEPWLEDLNNRFFQPLESEIQNSYIYNPWFTEDNVRMALAAIASMLEPSRLAIWLNNYDLPGLQKSPKTVAVVMAGNIPLVGFHDMLCVLMSGHNLLAKLSAKDERLPKFLAEICCFLNKDFCNRIIFADGLLKDFDAVIATGGNNTSRYFEYYFGKKPHIIRKNRNSVAILDGSETDSELQGLSDDIFRYFGLGCRNVSKLFLPEGYDTGPLIQSFETWRHYADHHHWANNYEYQRAIHLIDRVPHLDNGFAIIREDTSPASPIAVLNYEKVRNGGNALETALGHGNAIQCVIGRRGMAEGIVPFGSAQDPGPDQYADNIDTMEFLIKL
jgi:hypothetical protein